MKWEYTLATNEPMDRSLLRRYLEEKIHLYKLPCKITIIYGGTSTSYYIEASNVRNGVMVISWDNLANPMRKEWDRVS